MPVLIRANTQAGRLVQVQGFTLVVSAHGGILELPLEVAINQRLVLINPHYRNEAPCRVVGIEGPAQAVFEVAFEFEQPNAEFWPINFPEQSQAFRGKV
jgi:hypothetical protein